MDNKQTSICGVALVRPDRASAKQRIRIRPLSASFSGLASKNQPPESLARLTLLADALQTIIFELEKSSFQNSNDKNIRSSCPGRWRSAIRRRSLRLRKTYFSGTSSSKTPFTGSSSLIDPLESRRFCVESASATRFNSRTCFCVGYRGLPMLW
jgi:hypothetical protein